MKWQELRLPRRGSEGLTPWQPDPDAPAAVEALVKRRKWINAMEKMLAHPASDGALIEAARAHDTDLGRATNALLLYGAAGRDSADPIVDTWFIEHGPAGAVRIMMELTGLYLPPYYIAEGTIRRFPGDHTGPDEAEHFAELFRSKLAAADQAVYDEAIGELATYRDRPFPQRSWASVLAPGEKAWVDEDIAVQPDEVITMSPNVVRRLFTIAYRPEQAKQADHISPNGWGAPLDHSSLAVHLATLVDGMGVAALDALPYQDRSFWYAFIRDSAARLVLAELDDDRGYELAIDEVATPGNLDVLLTAAARHPARALRLLAAAPDRRHRDGAWTARQRLRLGLVLRALAARYPGEVDVAAAALPERAANRLRQASEVTYAPPGAIPPELAAPPAPLPDDHRGSRIVAVTPAAQPALSSVIRLRDGSGALPPEVVGNLYVALERSYRDVVDPVVEVARRTLQTRDLGAFVWNLQEWEWDTRKGYVSRSSVELLGDDETVRLLGVAQLAIPKGPTGVNEPAAETLRRIGTPAALDVLFQLAKKAPNTRVKDYARGQLRALGRELGLTEAQLADRALPPLGLAADGTMELDFGPRRFTVGFDDALKPYIVDGAGKRRASLPKAAATDDADLAAEAHDAFKDVKKATRTLATRQLRRLESAMVGQDRWQPADFEQLTAHVLVRLLARRLVWLQDGTGFRPTDDGSYTDVDDKPYTLGAGPVGVAHPIELGGALAGWRQQFDDYELGQPFEQVNREIHPAPADADWLERYRGRPTNRARLLGLQSRGWTLDDPMRGSTFEKKLVAGRAMIHFDPGFSHAGWENDQKLAGVGVWPSGPLDPITASELIRDLEAVVLHD